MHYHLGYIYENEIGRYTKLNHEQVDVDWRASLREL